MDFNFIITRTKNILFNPHAEWETIAGENHTMGQVFKNYALPMMIAVAAANFLGSMIFNSFFSFSFKILSTIISFIVPLVSLYISSWVINKLANNFGSRQDINAAFKLMAYSSAPSYVISIITGLIPFLFFLNIASLYTIFLIWTGLSPVMQTPYEKKSSYIILAVLIILVVYFLATYILGLVLLPFMVATTISI